MNLSIITCIFGLFIFSPTTVPSFSIGEFNGIQIYSGGDNSVNRSESGYRYGLKWQCVEFVKRYYFDYLEHTMPNVWGHAIDYFDPSVSHGSMNNSRGLFQFENGNKEQPRENDLLVLNWAEPYGHVAIISEVTENHIKIAQQNAGPAFIKLTLTKKNGHYTIGEEAVGWLRKP